MPDVSGGMQEVEVARCLSLAPRRGPGAGRRSGRGERRGSVGLQTPAETFVWVSAVVDPTEERARFTCPPAPRRPSEPLRTLSSLDLARYPTRAASSTCVLGGDRVRAGSVEGAGKGAPTARHRAPDRGPRRARPPRV